MLNIYGVSNTFVDELIIILLKSLNYKLLIIFYLFAYIHFHILA